MGVLNVQRCKMIDNMVSERKQFLSKKSSKSKK